MDKEVNPGLLSQMKDKGQFLPLILTEEEAIRSMEQLIDSWEEQENKRHERLIPQRKETCKYFSERLKGVDVAKIDYWEGIALSIMIENYANLVPMGTAMHQANEKFIDSIVEKYTKK